MIKNLTLFMGLTLIGLGGSRSIWVAYERSQPIATIGTTSLTASDFMANLKKTPPDTQQAFSSSEGKRKFLKQLIEAKLMVLATQKAGYRVSIGNDELIGVSKGDTPVHTYFIQKLAPQFAISDAEITTYARQHPNAYGTDPKVNNMLIEAQLADDRLKKWFEKEKDAAGVSINEAAIDALHVS